ncbi:MAG: hypothetical protein J0I12_23875 [Candidatus Eremiobacteraeota bacterium]|nr:hypothetical protein [Candidatus Eremiobacteraeota bacterium]
MKIYLSGFWLLLTLGAFAQEGFSPTLPWGTRNVQAGEIHSNSGFSPTMPYVKVSDPQTQHDNPHQDQSRSNYCPRPYGYYSNYYYGPGSGYYYGPSFQGQTYDGQSTPSSGIPGYDKPLPSNAPPGY